MEEEQRLAEEERRRLAEEESRRLEQEEQAALDALYRSVAEEHFGETEGTADVPEATQEPAADAGELVGFFETVSEESGLDDDGLAADVLHSIVTDGELDESFFEEVAAAMEAEPMWEEDGSLGGVQEFPESFEGEAAMTEEDEASEMTDEAAEGAYEQISLFAQKENDIVPEEPKELSLLGKELSARLSENGIVFEEVLHEFASIERVRKQLARMLEVVVTVRKKCHCLIITGDERSGKTSLGTYLAKLLYDLSYVKTPRVAKISGERLNRINLFEKQEQLKDVCLIVEKAGDMTESTAEGLLEFIRQTDVLGTVILEDNANAINRLLRNHGECNREFNNRVHLPKYDTEELMLFALGSIAEQDYIISGETKKILFERIEAVTRVEPKEGRLWATMEMVKAALKNADDRNRGAILAMASAGSFLAAEAMELTAEDFGIKQ